MPENLTSLQIIILGLVQGLTEFLPISSSGHLVLTPKLLGFTDPGLAVDAFLHLGTLFAVVIYFRSDILWLIRGFLYSFEKPVDEKFIEKKSEMISKVQNPMHRQLKEMNKKLSWGIIWASVPVVIIGLFFKDFFETETIRSTNFVAYMLISGALLMLIPDLLLKGEGNIAKLSKFKMFFVGCMQCLALFPGVSRSGSTIAAGLFVGLKRDEAARFAFLVGLPAIAGAGLLAVKDLLDTYAIEALPLDILGLGFLVSFVSGYLAIDFLMKFLQKRSLMWFVVYRIALAAYLLY